MATIPTGRFVWFDHISNDDRKARAFFGELFHWKTKEAPTTQGVYSMIVLGDREIGGYRKPFPGAPQHAFWLPHLQVASAPETAAKAKSIGGKIVKEPSNVDGIGTLAIVADPQGAMLALWQPTKPATGDYTGADGGWVWNELYTHDPDKAVAFYKAIAGFEVETMKMEGEGPDRYEILRSGGKGRAGIMKFVGVPPNWMPYVKVANVDATVAKAKQLGADVKMPGETIPGVGRLGVFLDPVGAPLGILQPAPM